MVFTRGHRDDSDNKSVLPVRECRKPRTTLQEPEDDMFWESDENMALVKKKSRSLGVTFKDNKILNLSLPNIRSGLLSRNKRDSINTKYKSVDSEEESEKDSALHLHNNQSDDLIGIEGDTDTDDDLYDGRMSSRMTQGLRNSKSRDCRHSPIKKEFVMNVDDELSEKSDHESGLRRSSRQKKFVSSSTSWLVENKKLRGYPNMMVQSSEPENEEPRPSRKTRRYLQSKKESTMSPPQPKLLRFRKQSNIQRSRGCVYLRERRSKRPLLQRKIRRPMRLRESEEDEEEGDEEDEEEEEGEGEEEEDDGEGEEDDEDNKVDNVNSIENKAEEKDEPVNEIKEPRSRVGRRLRKPIKHESEDDTENYNRKQSLSRRTKRTKMSRLERNCNRRSSYKTKDTEESSEDEINRNEAESEEKNNDEKCEKDSDNKESNVSVKKVVKRRRKSIDASPHNVIFEKPKRLRKPVSRLTYDHHNSNAASSSDESKDEEEEDDSEEEEEEQEENIDNRVRRYSLREKRKPKIMADPFEEANSHRHRKERDKLSHFLNSPARKPVFNKKYRSRATHARTMSSSSSSSDEKEFEKRKSKSMAKSRSRCLPMNLTQDDLALGSIRDRTKIGSSLADIDPMSIDTSVSFETIGGLDHHIKSLKEMIVFPLLYPEVFQKFNVTPPRGVLFFGPPGTGKTLVARALANECSQEDKKVAFFMRKGADCLSKWVGESERQLRLLFDQAYQMRPAIIFFDEIDGLAPVRSTRQDQIHSSIVSTLLALMDGLDSRGEVVVIGATNRVDAIDPALRRPGRFDREFLFPLPSSQARSQILDIHTKQWTPPPSKRLIQYLVDQTVGYCGADLKALCAEATLNALRMRYPQIYLSKHKLQLDVSKIQVKTCHFRQSLSKIVPAGQRSVSNPGRKLSKTIRPLLQPILQEVLRILKQSFGIGFNKSAVGLISHRPRILVTGSKGQGHTTHLSPAILHAMENVPNHKLDLPSLFCVSARAPEEACAQVFLEARRNLPSIIYLPSIDQWWKTVSDTVRASFISLLNDLESSMPLLLLATSEEPYDMLEDQVRGLFSLYRKEVFVMNNPHEDHRRHFFRPLFFTEFVRKPKILRNKNRVLEELPVAPPPLPRKLNENELKKIEEVEEATLRELRIFLRQICAKLAKNRMFYIFTKPVDLHEVPDYTEVIRSPMDLETMMTKIDQHKYECAEDFLKDIDLICSNALEYNPDRNPEDKLIRHRACTLRDTAYAYIKAEMDTDFEMKCRDIRRVRVKRIQPVAGAPDFIRVGPPVTKLAAEAVAGDSNKLSPDLGSSEYKKKYKKRKRSSNWARGFITKKRKTDKENVDDNKKEIGKENENEDQEENQVLTEEENQALADEENQVLTEEENENNDCEESSEAGGESCVDSSGRIDDEVETGSDKVIVESSINLCNGNVSTEDSLDSMKITSAEDFLYNKSLNEAIMKETGEETLEGDEAVVSSSEPGCSGDKSMDLIIDWSHLESVYDSCIACTDDATVEELHYLYTVLIGLAQKHNALTDRSSLFNDVESEIRKFAQFRVKP